MTKNCASWRQVCTTALWATLLATSALAVSEPENGQKRPALFANVHQTSGHFVLDHIHIQTTDSNNNTVASNETASIVAPSPVHNVTAHSRPSNVTRPVAKPTPTPDSPYPLPIHVIANDVDVVESGFCFESCSHTTAATFDSWIWYSTVAERHSYNVSMQSMNPLVAASARVLTTRGAAAAKFGVIPLQNDPVEFPYFNSITYEPVCRSTGVVVFHIEILDARGVFQPVNFFAKHVCEVAPTNDCEGVTCAPHGICSHGRCECLPNYFGADCSHSIFDHCPNKCSGRASNCVANDGTFVCVCMEGFTGSSCEISNGCSELNFCHGHGECIAAKACACEFGWTGVSCNRTTDTDSTCRSLQYCKGHGKCVPRGRTFGCECDSGFEGADCGLVAAPCPASCSGHGLCKDGSCVCNFGFRGSDCSEAFSPCNGCMHGTCSESIDDAMPRCICHSGFTGPHCSLYDLYSDPCANRTFCSAHGKCNNGECECAPGFGGSSCEQVVVKGCVNGCSGHGKCNAKTDSCECIGAWSGVDCNTPNCPSTEGRLCSGHGACVQQGDVMECVCGVGFFGPSCHNAYCHHNTTCHGHGTCKKSSGVWDRLCECSAGWTGPTCETPAPSLAKKGKARLAATYPAKIVPDTTAEAAAVAQWRKRKDENAIEISDSVDDFLDTAP